MSSERDILKHLAYGLSAVLFPLFTPTYLMVVFCALFSQYMLPLPARYWWFAVGGTMLFTCILPFAVLIIMKLQGRISDLDVSNRHERLVPFLYSIMFFSIWCAYLDAVLKVPTFMFWTAVCSVLALVACAIISHWWKISAHLASMGGVVGMIIGYLLYFGLNAPVTVSLLLVMSLLLMYARIYLNAHTPEQTVCGFLLGLVFTLTPNIILLYV